MSKRRSSSKRSEGEFVFLTLSGKQVRDFTREHSEKALLVEKTLDCIWQAYSLSVNTRRDEDYVWITGCQQLHNYIREASLASIRRHCEIGLALSRLACELSRDIFRLVEKPEHSKLWLSGRKSEYQLFKNTFKFDRVDTVEQALFSLYNLTSEFGVHSHKPILEKAGDLTHNGQDYVVLSPPLQTIFDTLFLTCSVGQLFVLRLLHLLGPRIQSGPQGISHYAAAIAAETTAIDLNVIKIPAVVSATKQLH